MFRIRNRHCGSCTAFYLLLKWNAVNAREIAADVLDAVMIRMYSCCEWWYYIRIRTGVVCKDVAGFAYEIVTHQHIFE